MFAVVPLDSPLIMWPKWLMAGLCVTFVVVLTLAAALLALAWQRRRRRRRSAELQTPASNGERWADFLGDGWDRLREHSATLSAIVLTVVALGVVWRWSGVSWLGILPIGISPAGTSLADRAQSVVSPAGAPTGEISEGVPWRSGPDWPMDRGSAARLAVQGAGLGPGERRPRLRWRLGRPDEAFYASPAISGNRVYAVGNEGDLGRVVALDLVSGKLVWSGGPPGMRATFSSPVLAGDRLICGEGLHSTRDARVFALALESEPAQAGRLLWSFSTRGHVECTPTIAEIGRADRNRDNAATIRATGSFAEERIYFQAGDDGIYALSSGQAGLASKAGPASGSGPVSGANGHAPAGPPQLAFHQVGRNYPDAETALLVDGGVIYAGLGYGGESLVLLDAATGRELDRLATAWPVFAPPAAADAAVYIGMGDADFANPAGTKRSTRRGPSGGNQGADPSRDSGGAVWRLERGSLRVVWRRDLPGAVLGLAASPDGELIASCGDGRVYGIAADNSAVRSWPTGSAISAPLAVAGRYVYGVNHGGWLFAIDRHAMGESLLWRWRLGEPGAYVSGPVVVGDWLVLGTPRDGLVCVEPAAGDNTVPNQQPGGL